MFSKFLVGALFAAGALNICTPSSAASIATRAGAGSGGFGIGAGILATDTDQSAGGTVTSSATYRNYVGRDIETFATASATANSAGTLHSSVSTTCFGFVINQCQTHGLAQATTELQDVLTFTRTDGGSIGNLLVRVGYDGIQSPGVLESEAQYSTLLALYAPNLGGGPLFQSFLRTDGYTLTTGNWASSGSLALSTIGSFHGTIFSSSNTVSYGLGFQTNLLATQGQDADFSNTATLDFIVPEGVTVTSQSGLFRRFSTAAGAVPEPATWAMMILGFGGVGAMVRRRRQAHAA